MISLVVRIYLVCKLLSFQLFHAFLFIEELVLDSKMVLMSCCDESHAPLVVAYEKSLSFAFENDG